MMIRPFIPQLIIDKKHQKNEIVDSLYNSLGGSITKKDIGAIINKYSIEKLFTVKLDLDEISKKIEDTQKMITNITNETYKKYKEFYKKFAG